MPTTLVAVFDQRAAARRAIEALARDGFDKRHIRATQTPEAPEDARLAQAALAINAREAAARSGAPPVAAEAGIVPETASAYMVPFPIEAGVMPYPIDVAGVAPLPDDDDGVFGHIRSFFAELFGPGHVPATHDVARYTNAVQGGGAIVRVRVDDAQAAGRARRDLESAGATHVEELPT
jgi:hypothetical protein